MYVHKTGLLDGSRVILANDSHFSFKAKLAQESDSEEELFTTRSKTKEQEVYS